MNAFIPPLWIIPAFPAAGALIIFLFSRWLTLRGAGKLACTTVGLAFAWVLFCGSYLLTLPVINAHAPGVHERLWTWLNAGTIRSEFGFYFDRITLVFGIIVTGVGWLIHLYSYAYMEEDEGERRYFGYLNLFVAAMLVLVMASNGFLMFMGWEGVGACSFLLIGFWYKKSENVSAAVKAFLVTRVGDVFLILGLLLLAQITTLNFPMFGGLGERMPLTADQRHLVAIAALLLLGGAVGKSAQLPLQTWLPDAMAGPTPVSALIHAATMVTAGVYLVARFHVVFCQSPAVMTLVSCIGIATALYGAGAAIVQTDIKRILAYSTISQIGYMVLGVGAGAFSAGLFHFFTHGFYKALLFLAAGAVIHALGGEQNVYNMGGLRRRMPGVFLAFLAGAASLAGIPLITAGFFSKDAVLAGAYLSQYAGPIFYALGLATAFLTAVYSFRLVFIVFFGEPRRDIHLHKPAWLLRWPLYVLAFFAITAGYLNVPVFFPWWERFFEPVFGEWETRPGLGMHEKELIGAAASGVLALMGAVVAWWLYAPSRNVRPAPVIPAGEIQNTTPAPFRSRLANFAFHGFGFDWLYNRLFITPYRRATGLLTSFDLVAVDGFYTMLGLVVGGLHNVLAFFQNSRLSRYALVMLFGALAVTTILLWGIR